MEKLSDYPVVTIRDYSAFFNATPGLRATEIQNCLVFAHNLIFTDFTYDEFGIELEDWQLEKLNLLLTAGLNLIRTAHVNIYNMFRIYSTKITDSDPVYCPQFDRCVQGAINHLINNQINKHKKTNTMFVALQDGKERTRRMRNIEDMIGIKPYKIRAAIIFYLTEFAASALKNNQIVKYGELVGIIHRITRELEHEMVTRSGGEAVHSTEKSLANLYKGYLDYYQTYGEEEGFDWGKYADSDCIKNEFLKCAQTNQIQLPKRLLDLYELECLKQKNKI